jgi:peptidoglycan/LPS O-acetylase OafA/YrhL
MAALILLVCVLSMYDDYVSVNGLNRASIIAYEIFSRPAWSLAIGWILFLCSTDQGGIVNTILSWPIWTPLTRLNYATYLIHLTIIYVTIYNQTMPFYYQPLTVINNYISQLFFSYVAAIPVVIFLETPFFIIEKKLFKR